MLKAGIIGTGKIARAHLEALSRSQKIKLIGITAEDQEEATYLAREYNLPLFPDAESLIRKSDIVDITASGEYSFTSSIAAVRDFRHVFLNAGFTWSIDEARLLYKLSQEAGVRVGIHNLKRYNRTFLSALRFVSNPQFTEIHLCETGVQGNRELIASRMIQTVDLATLLNRNNVKRIHTHSVAMKDQSTGLLQVRIEFDNGSVTSILYNRMNGKPVDSVSCFSDEGTLKIDFLNGLGSYMSFPYTARKTFTGDVNAMENIDDLIHQLVNPADKDICLATIDDLFVPLTVTSQILDRAGLRIGIYN